MDARPFATSAGSSSVPAVTRQPELACLRETDDLVVEGTVTKMKHHAGFDVIAARDLEQIAMSDDTATLVLEDEKSVRGALDEADLNGVGMLMRRPLGGLAGQVDEREDGGTAQGAAAGTKQCNYSGTADRDCRPSAVASRSRILRPTHAVAPPSIRESVT